MTATPKPSPAYDDHADHWAARAYAWVVPRRRTDLDVQELDDEAVLFDPKRGDTHRLNAIAYEVWLRCDGQSTTRQLAARLAGGYEIDFESALDDVEQLILGFAELHLVRVAPAVTR